MISCFRSSSILLRTLFNIYQREADAIARKIASDAAAAAAPAASRTNPHVSGSDVWCYLISLHLLHPVQLSILLS